MEIRGYSSPKAFGHRLVNDILDGHVIIQEKVDGSQLSFGVFDGELCVRSHNAQVDLEAPGMFGIAVEHLKTVTEWMTDGCTYRGEYLAKPKHNTLSYDRIPKGHIVLFDVDTGNTSYLIAEELVMGHAMVLGLEPVATLWEGDGKEVTLDMLKNLLETESILGGEKIEGVVIKNYDKYIDDKVMMAKYVSTEFREKHGTDWKQRNPGTIEFIISQFNKEAIWNKAVQHLSEDGELDREPKDIGKLMKELNIDIKREHEEEIKEMLYASEIKKIIKGITNGFPEWYKEQLAEKAFEK